MRDYMKAKGWLRPEEREYLYYIARKVPAQGLIVNIGTEYGASLVCLRSGNPECDIVGIDLDTSLAPQDLDIIYIEGNSADYAEDAPSWLGAYMDLLFVDGDHTYEGVLKDCRYADYVNIGGHVVFHDCYDYQEPVIDGMHVVHGIVPGVNQAVSEWYRENSNCWTELGAVGTMRIFKRITCVK